MSSFLLSFLSQILIVLTISTSVLFILVSTNSIVRNNRRIYSNNLQYSELNFNNKFLSYTFIKQQQQQYQKQINFLNKATIKAAIRDSIETFSSFQLYNNFQNIIYFKLGVEIICWLGVVVLVLVLEAVLTSTYSSLISTRSAVEKTANNHIGANSAPAISCCYLINESFLFSNKNKNVDIFNKNNLSHLISKSSTIRIGFKLFLLQ